MNASRLFDRASIQAVDREAVERFGIPGIVLMENAARGLLDAALSMMCPGPTIICCGPGNNGGDGYALGRHLANRGADVILVPVGEPREGGDAAINRDICRKMRIAEASPANLERSRAGLIVDAILGTGLHRPVRDPAAGWIDWINAGESPVLAVDVPSGLDCDTGSALGRAVRADRTATMVGWKRGFLAEGARAFTGEVVVVDIGAPRELVEIHGKAMPAGAVPGP